MSSVTHMAIEKLFFKETITPHIAVLHSPKSVLQACDKASAGRQPTGSYGRQKNVIYRHLSLYIVIRTFLGRFEPVWVETLTGDTYG